MAEAKKPIIEWIKDQEKLERQSLENIWQSLDLLNAKLLPNTTFANKLFAEIDKIDWSINLDSDAQKVVESLIKHKVAIDKMLLEHGEKIFESNNLKLLLELNKQWANQGGITAEEIAQRKLVLQLAYSKCSSGMIDANNLLNQIKGYPLDLVNTIIQKPKNMSDIDYINWLKELNEKLNPSVYSRDGEIQILIMNQILIYEAGFKGKQYLLQNITEDVIKTDNESKTINTADCGTSKQIKEYIEKQQIINQSSFLKFLFGDDNERLALDIYNALGYARIYDEELRKKVVHSVVSNKIALPYIVAVAEKRNTQDVLKKIEGAKSTLGFKDTADTTDTTAVNDKLSIVLEQISQNTRLREGIVTRIIAKFRRLNRAEQSEILASADGHQNVHNMVKVMQTLNLKNAAYMEMIMSDVMNELQPQHNLDPSLYGAIGRNYNYVMSYPSSLFLYVLHSLYYMCEYVCSLGKAEKSDKVADEFEQAFKKFAKDIDIINSIADHKLSNEVLLRDQLLNVLKKYRDDPEITLENLKKAVKILPIEKNENSQCDITKELSANDFISNPTLKSEFKKLIDCTTPKAFADAAYKLLDHPSMKQGIDQLPTWSKVARGVAVLSKTL